MSMIMTIRYGKEENPFDKKLMDEIRMVHGDERSFPKYWRNLYLKGDNRYGMLATYSPIAIEYRQIHGDVKKGDPLVRFSGHLLFFHNQQGIAYGHYTKEDGTHAYGWFEFGCPHEECTRENVGCCLNKYTCKACGYAETIDSSD